MQRRLVTLKMHRDGEISLGKTALKLMALGIH
jgi:hypothetical protein